MGAKITVGFTGGRELDAALAQFKPSTAKGVLRHTGVAALQVFDAAWREKARRRTGALAESGGVGTKLSRAQKQATDHESFVEVYAGPGPLVQAIQEEFGNDHEAPHPMLRPAWDETKEQVLQNVKTGLKAEIDKTAARVKARAAKAG